MTAPSWMTTTSSAYAAASSSWVTMTTVIPSSRTERRRWPRTAAYTKALGQGVKHVIDSGFASGEARLLDQALAGMIGIAAALAVATWFRFYLMMTLGERVVTDLRRAVFDHILGLEPAFFEATRTGEVISRLTNDATLLQQVIGYGLSMFLRNGLMMAGAHEPAEGGAA